MEVPAGTTAPGNAREPCPDRIFDDVGGAFAMGAIGGTTLQFIKGVYTSPKGSRLVGGVQLARLNGPRIGGSFGVWGGLFSTFDCTMVYLRQKEDPWNSILAGAGTGGFLTLRQGVRPAIGSAIFGGILLALIEGVGIAFNNYGKHLEAAAQMPPPGMDNNGLPQQYVPNQVPLMHQQQHQQVAGDSQDGRSSSWLGGLFGSGNNQETTSGSGGSKDEILESFDAPIASVSGLQLRQPQPAENSEKPSSWGGGLFGWGKKEESTGLGSKTEILESFDAPRPPVSYDNYK